MVKERLLGGTATLMRDNLKMGNITEKENSSGHPTKNSATRENSNEARCMALAFSIIPMEYLKASSDSGSSRVKLSLTSVTETNTQASFIILK